MKRCIKWLSITLVLLLVSKQVIIFLVPHPPLLTTLSFSRAVFDEEQRLLRLTLNDEGRYRLFTPINSISPHIIQATLLQEDQYFFHHIGINPLSLIKAGWQTYGKGVRRVGASTITMQVARIRFNIRSKTFLGKIQQILRALQLELHYSKAQILEAYLNLAPYGNNIEGIGAASLIYFDKSAQRLTLPEALTLVVIPQHPNKRIANLSVLKTMRNKLFERWVMLYPEDKNKQALMALPLQLRSLRHAPFLAPHFVNEVLSHSGQKDQILTTLNLSLQQIIERVTHQYLLRKHHLGVNNAAILLVDSRDMGIKALIGSGDFFNTAIGGQVNGTSISRSPGSALKPFIYALALEQGLIHPATILKDAPHSFGAYNPENFDNDFVGPIKARDALIMSRNIPAVYLADQLKHPNLYEFLLNAGISGLKSEDYYGLSLVLGGVELTMQELVGLYAALVNEGIWHPLTFFRQPFRHHKRLLSAEASFLVLDILKDAPISTTIPSTLQNQIAWKTGTSSGYRDAWTVGSVGPYILGVWLGNFNNQGNHAFIGKELAAPLFFEIVNALSAQLRTIPLISSHPQHLNLTKVAVCRVSGMLPMPFCPDVEEIWFIPGKSPIKKDTIHREIAIDVKTGLRACRFDENVVFKVYEFWSSDLLHIFKRAGIQRQIPPPYEQGCAMQSNSLGGFAPQIISPQLQVQYVARVGSKKSNIIPFSAIVDADVQVLYWFLNETYLGKTRSDQSYLWTAKPGNYVVRVVDDHGRSHARKVVVKQES